ncbi:MAG: O-antigen ligase family protein [Flavobacteriales bacterium]|nr:O-antigen ligase family protein [Flavobacteriales bacterium]
MNAPTGITGTLRATGTHLVQAFGRLGAAGLCLLLLALPALPAAVPVALMLFIVGWGWHQRSGWKQRGRPSWRDPLPWMMAFFLLHVLGMAWTEDVGFGLFDLEIKATLLVLPAVALLLPPFGRDVRQAALFLAAWACALTVMGLLVAALFRLATTGGLDPALELFSARFSPLVHPSYLAQYLVFALGAWVLTPLHRQLGHVAGGIVVVLLCLGVVLSGSKMGWILLVLTLGSALVLRWQDRGLRRLLLLLAGGSTAGLVALVLLSPYASSRLEEAWQAAFSERVDDRAETSSAVRRITWSAATTLIAEQPLLGTGTGDIKNELLRIYAERWQEWVLEHRLNAHSQFLQSTACLGLAGGLVLLCLVLLPLAGPWRKDPVVWLFLLSCGLNWAVESMLEVQAGVVWTALVAVLVFRTRTGIDRHSSLARP